MQLKKRWCSGKVTWGLCFLLGGGIGSYGFSNDSPPRAMSLTVDAIDAEIPRGDIVGGDVVRRMLSASWWEAKNALELYGNGDLEFPYLITAKIVERADGVKFLRVWWLSDDVSVPELEVRDRSGGRVGKLPQDWRKYWPESAKDEFITYIRFAAVMLADDEAQRGGEDQGVSVSVDGEIADISGVVLRKEGRCPQYVNVIHEYHLFSE